MEMKPITSVFNIEIEKIDPNPDQPRKHFNDEALRDLAESIRRYGVMQPITVTRRENVTPDGGITTRYEIIAGERRWRASIIAGMASVPAIIRESEDTEQERFELSILENLQREDLNPVDKARSFARLSDEFGMKHAEIADKLGKSREYVTNALRLLVLPENILDALSAGEISEGHTRPMLSLKDNPEQLQVLFSEIITKGLTVRDTEKVSRELLGSTKRVNRYNPAQVSLDPEIQDLQQQLSRSLGTPVSIDKKDKGGSLTIEFFSRDDLKKLLSIVGSSSLSGLSTQTNQSAGVQLPTSSDTQPVTVNNGTEIPGAHIVTQQVSNPEYSADFSPDTENSGPQLPDNISDDFVITPRGDMIQMDESLRGKPLVTMNAYETPGRYESYNATQRAQVLQQEIDALAQQTSRHEMIQPTDMINNIDLGTFDIPEPQHRNISQTQSAGNTMFNPDSVSSHTDVANDDGNIVNPISEVGEEFVPRGDSGPEIDMSVAGDEFVPAPTKDPVANESSMPASSATITMGGMQSESNTKSETQIDPYNLDKFSV